LVWGIEVNGEVLSTGAARVDWHPDRKSFRGFDER